MDGYEIQIPEDLTETQRRAYLRGLRDMAEYMQTVGMQAREIYEEEIEEQGDRCDCGAELIWTGTEKICPDCDT